MSKDEKEICLYCKWWRPNAPGEYIREDTRGICHLTPPAVIQAGDAVSGFHGVSVFATSRADSFCSKFENRPDDHDPDTWEHISRPAQRVIDGIEIE